MTTTAASKQALGRHGEAVAARHLVAAGLTILDRNWRCPEGELDLVLGDGSVVVACEVKTRSGMQCGTPHEAVDDAKLDRLQRLAARWVDVHRPGWEDVRVDLVAVLVPRRGPAQIDHVRGIG